MDISHKSQKYTPLGQIVYSFDTKDRPSLNFYSDRLIKRVGPQKIIQQWQSQSQPYLYLLVQASNLNNLTLENLQILNTIEGWTLVTRESKNRFTKIKIQKSEVKSDTLSI